MDDNASRKNYSLGSAVSPVGRLGRLASVNHWIQKLSYREGDFTLSSGKKSHFYIDLKATTLHPEGIYQIAEAAVDLILENQIEIQGVGGLTLGADPLATAISLSARARGLVWPAFIVRKEPKSHGTSQYIEGIENLPSGASVLVLEDVVTTGASADRAIERLKNAGYRPAAVLAVVDREEGGSAGFEAKGIPFFALTRLQDIAGMPKGAGQC